MQALASLSVIPPFTEEAQAGGGETAQAATQAAAPTEPATVTTTLHDDVARGVAGFFDEPQFATLNRLGEALMPEADDKPGARSAGAAELIDFHVSRSPEDRRSVYVAGLDALDWEAVRRFGKPFAETSQAEADSLLAPLREAWTPRSPKDPIAALLRVAKADVRNATVNSRAYIDATAEQDGRRRRGMGLYWYTIE
jgi:hypothetical protein